MSFTTAYNTVVKPGKQLLIISTLTAFGLGYFYYLSERHVRRHPYTRPLRETIEDLRTNYHYNGNAFKQDWQTFYNPTLTQAGLRILDDKEPLEEEEIEEREEHRQKILDEIEKVESGEGLAALWLAQLEE